MLKDLVIEKYIGENLFIDTTNGLELQMRGYKFVQFFAAALYEIVQPAENYVTFDLNASGYEPMNVVIQKKSKLSPHDKAKKLEAEVEKLKQENEDLRRFTCPSCGKEVQIITALKQYFVGCSDCYNSEWGKFIDKIRGL